MNLVNRKLYLNIKIKGELVLKYCTINFGHSKSKISTCIIQFKIIVHLLNIKILNYRTMLLNNLR